ncbi:MAG TPA: SDR family NAD(P)-dependent oxidoreductase [Polyangiaceae bacterium]|nr:SDR family NAD(P)-dependent oxidoreductase [Polyangiaceae bacterium]
MRVDGSVVVVTGGASGLGAAVARRLHGRGARVVVLDRAAEAGEALAGALGEGAAFAAGDVTDEAAVRAAFELGRGRFGPVRAVVGCAGVGTPGRVLSKDGPQPLEAFARTVQVNLLGMFNVVRLGAAAMADNEPNGEGERGVVVMTASVAAFDGQVGQAAYAASKGGVVAMTLPIARELARFGVRVVTVAPGLFDTPLLGALPEAARQSLGQQVPFPPRLGRPDEFAALVEHVVENPMLNGETIRLDGALRMAPK